jgi:hypothetical protein
MFILVFLPVSCSFPCLFFPLAALYAYIGASSCLQASSSCQRCSPLYLLSDTSLVCTLPLVQGPAVGLTVSVVRGASANQLGYYANSLSYAGLLVFFLFLFFFCVCVCVCRSLCPSLASLAFASLTHLPLCVCVCFRALGSYTNWISMCAFVCVAPTLSAGSLQIVGGPAWSSNPVAYTPGQTIQFTVLANTCM